MRYSHFPEENFFSVDMDGLLTESVFTAACDTNQETTTMSSSRGESMKLYLQLNNYLDWGAKNNINVAIW